MENDFIIQKPNNKNLQTWIDYYFLLDIPSNQLKIEEEYTFPFPRITFGYFFNNPFLVTNHTISKNISSKMIISKISTNKISVKPLTKRVKILGAHLKPYALGFLTNNNISEKPWIIKTEDLFFVTANEFKNSIDKLSEPKDMFIETERFFLKSALKKDLTILINAVQIIEKTKGNISIAKLAKKTKTTSRTLRNHFYKVIGCSPKEYILLVKLQQSIFQMKNSVDSLTSISYAQNFSDQAHFTKTVKSIIGVPPKEIRKEIPNFRFLQF